MSRNLILFYRLRLAVNALSSFSRGPDPAMVSLVSGLDARISGMACGTPVVGFNIGGNSDMIEHQHNGYLARPMIRQAWPPQH